MSEMSSPMLLTDQQVQDFLINGFLVLQPSSLDANFHASIFTAISSVFETDGNPGNNVLPRIPQLQRVFDDAVVRGALESLVGRNYTMQPHRHPHVTKPGGNDQNWHKDSYFGYHKLLRHHQLRYIMAMYYPQDTTLEMGPTAIQPRTQYNVKSDRQAEQNEIRLVCRAGTVVLIHYDLVHKGTANRTKNSIRFMFKFQFNRLEEPTRPTWNHDPANAAYNAEDAGLLQPIVKHVWHWLLGNDSSSALSSRLADDANIREWEQLLNMPDGQVRLNAAYNLALNDQYQLLLQRLHHSKEMYRLEAAYALTACRLNPDAIAAMQTALVEDEQHEERAACIAFILSEMGASAACALPVLTRVLQRSESWLVKRYCCEALGTIPSNNPDHMHTAVQCLINILAHRNEQPDSKEASHARLTAALSLAKLGPSAVAAVPALKDALESDPVRYVNGNALLALERIGTSEALHIVLNYLKSARWCPKTTGASLY